MTEFLKKSGCPHCHFIDQAILGALATKVFETDRVIVIAGDHQYFPGYCVVIAKNHVREMHHLPPEEAAKIFADVLAVGRKIEGAFKTHKMNYVSLGNVVEHLIRNVPWKSSTFLTCGAQPILLSKPLKPRPLVVNGPLAPKRG